MWSCGEGKKKVIRMLVEERKGKGEGCRKTYFVEGENSVYFVDTISNSL